jgi:hypothetical protein
LVLWVSSSQDSGSAVLRSCNFCLASKLVKRAYDKLKLPVRQRLKAW